MLRLKQKATCMIATEGFTARYEHETVALAFALTEEAVEDNLYDRLGSDIPKH